MAKNIKDTPADLESFTYEKVENDYFSNPIERLKRRTSEQFKSQLGKILTMCDSNFEWTGVEYSETLRKFNGRHNNKKNKHFMIIERIVFYCSVSVSFVLKLFQILLSRNKQPRMR